MERIGDLLQRYSPQGPDDVMAVKRYIAETFSTQVSVGAQGEALVVTVPSASLANTLRMRTVAIQEAANTTKRLIFRIG